MKRVTLNALDKGLARTAALIAGTTAVVTALGTLLTTTEGVLKAHPYLPLVMLWLSVLAMVGLGILLLWPRGLPGMAALKTPVGYLALGILLVVGAPLAGWTLHRNLVRPPFVEQIHVKRYLADARRALDQKDRRTALAALEQAAKIAPEDPGVLQMRGAAQSLSPEEEKALAQFKRFARASIREGAWEHAREMTDRAERIAPWDTEVRELRQQSAPGGERSAENASHR